MESSVSWVYLKVLILIDNGNSNSLSKLYLIDEQMFSTNMLSDWIYLYLHNHILNFYLTIDLLQFFADIQLGRKLNQIFTISVLIAFLLP